jgi:hypothetical protein
MRDAQGSKTLWLIWTLATLALAGWLGYRMLAEHADKRLFMPGPLSPGHHQLALACAACHGDPLGGGEVLQEACVKCHGAVRRKPFDSHPAAKFRDPRNADRLGNIDALHCVTCHSEHRPQITAMNGVTQPADLCFHCHKDVAKDRPSHKGMDFASCHDSGCHNFHDNRALYTDFLIRHLDEPDVLDQPQLPAREYATLLDQLPGYPLARYPVRPLSAADADAPAAVLAATPADTLRDWAASAHARSGVNCTACHEQVAPDSGRAQWVERPAMQACKGCHDLELQRFEQGKHGMKLAVGLPPLQVAEALLPMRKQAAHETLTCNSCHGAHTYDVQHAAVDGCLQCHNDTHTLAYRQSSHSALWQREQRGELAAGRGVSCASCHMPRVQYAVNDWLSRTMVDHDQSDNLSPNSKMIRTSCMACHGLGFSIDAMADRKLIDNNFNGRPSVHVGTMELAAAEAKRRASEAGKDDDTSMFGF